MRTARALIVEDDRELVSRIAAALAADRDISWSVSSAYDGNDGLALLGELRPDILILDLGLPGLHGYELLREVVRAKGNTRVCIITVSDSLEERLTGFREGADDYLCKPFSEEELLARVTALLRRDRIRTDANLVYGDLHLAANTRTVSRGGVAIKLTKREFDLLSYLAARPGLPITRNELLEEVWQGKDLYPNVVDAVVESLRQKVDKPFGSPLIQTMYGIGYSFVPTNSEKNLKKNILLIGAILVTQGVVSILS